ncbi:MAG: hypothetical protein Q8R32_01570, partial [bacterium]|nr:hypothetical protein [bacterium]
MLSPLSQVVAQRSQMFRIVLFAFPVALFVAAAPFMVFSSVAKSGSPVPIDPLHRPCVTLRSQETIVAETGFPEEDLLPRE